MIRVSDGRPMAHFGAPLWSGAEGGLAADKEGLETARNLGRRTARLGIHRQWVAVVERSDPTEPRFLGARCARPQPPLVPFSLRSDFAVFLDSPWPSPRHGRLHPGNNHDKKRGHGSKEDRRQPPEQPTAVGGASFRLGLEPRQPPLRNRYHSVFVGAYRR